MKLDDFESVFRSAVKDRFHYQAPDLTCGLVIADTEAAGADALCKQVAGFLGPGHHDLSWSFLSRNEYSQVSDVLDRVRRNPPSLIACQRHLLGQGTDLPYTLGSTVDTLTQATDVPVMLLPKGDTISKLPDQLSRVMVMTDHITGDDRLVSWAVTLAPEHGTVYLGHIEDDQTFLRYVDALSKIPGIDTQTVVDRLRDKLLSLPRDYMGTIASALAEHGIHERVVPIVALGHRLRDYLSLLDEHDIDLLVMNTKDDTQLAMHGAAYALSVEIRDRPLLLL